ncbi:biotin--[acetyl-CoA-carboxylase] ligase [Noviherbaspirillum aridicola]|uniref:biotin--[biotin carboxyl-carrier protein] ligase n=1 Tax=Noviherbaspirillum aridicola TaxID=2849687 RepID=A0ABQ4Q0Q7_9BURK|nr:biotin--[acetyl-CoA-carboxylase] ligase [Noviherbaspirillum aridicola]GIZ50746.1 biotin--[acetyl-CoA-carboxylase] ligase [Noviherbaspirillum aridicola]
MSGIFPCCMAVPKASRYNAGMTALLTPEQIAALCRPAAQRVDVRVVEETGSTNADLMAALPGLTGPRLLIARHQRAGRGRAGRPWQSRPGQSLTFSLAWKFERGLQALVGLPLAVGVTLAETLALFGAEVRLKWPNDLLLEGRKAAGILIESAAAGPGSWAVIGIGINLALDEETVAGLDRPVASLAPLAAIDQNLLMAALLSALAEMLEEFAQQGLAPFAARWNRLHAYAGQPVAILENGRALHEGIGVGVDEVGRFLIDTGAGRVAVMAGDVSLRPKE